MARKRKDKFYLLRIALAMAPSSFNTLLVIFWMLDSMDATLRSNNINTRREYTIAANVPMMTARITSANSSSGMVRHLFFDWYSRMILKGYIKVL